MDKVSNQLSSIDVDIGGTFTDCYVTYRGKRVISKTPTTAHNLSIGFLKAIQKAADVLEVAFDDLVCATEIIRYSTTVAMNRLLERSGPRLALITTEGFEDVIFVGKGSQWADGLTPTERRDVSAIDKPIPLIERELVFGARERIDSQGKVVRPLDETHFLDGLDELVDKGARGFVVSLLSSFLNAKHEERIRELIEQEYPDSYLGRMPIMLSSQVLTKRFEYSRTITTILNAYLHRGLSDEIALIREELRARGYTNPLMLVHNTGGMADAFRTKAVSTFNGGPVAGLIGSAHLGTQYGESNVIFTDMGGTSFDLGLIVEGSTRFYQFQPIIDRWLVDLTMMETKSIGAGGGSIAWINDALADRLEVGPRSAGSNPGPAAYDQGGTEATVTDADVVLGYLNPEFFHEGKMKLNVKRSRRAIRQHVADPLGLEVEEAAVLIKEVVNAKMGDAIYKETVLRGYDPRDFILYASGGAGPTHAAWYAFRVGVKRVLVFPFSPVFGAFGSTTMDIVHVHERSRRVELLEPDTGRRLTDFVEFNAVVRDLMERAQLDIINEGFDSDGLRYSLELDMKYGGQLNITRVTAPVLLLNDLADVDAIVNAFAQEYSEAYSPLGAYPEAGVEIKNFAVRSTLETTKPQLESLSMGPSDPTPASKGKREAYWDEYSGFAKTDVFDGNLLTPGNVVQGPALVEAAHTTIVTPPGYVYRIDEFANGVTERG